MAKLNQIIAIESSIKSKAKTELDNLYKSAQKQELYMGLNKTYQPKEETGEVLPPEHKRVQLVAQLVLTGLQTVLTDILQITARKDWTNTAAFADVKVDDVVILPLVPVTYLLFLEKNLTDVRTVIGSIPVLDGAEDWKIDPNTGLYKTDPVVTNRSKKIARAIVLYPHSDKHPAQTQLIQEDIIDGFWNTVKLSGAMQLPTKQNLLKRVDILLKAVKLAREEANMKSEVTPPDVAEAVFGFILGKE